MRADLFVDLFQICCTVAQPSHLHTSPHLSVFLHFYSTCMHSISYLHNTENTRIPMITPPQRRGRSYLEFYTFFDLFLARYLHSNLHSISHASASISALLRNMHTYISSPFPASRSEDDPSSSALSLPSS